MTFPIITLDPAADLRSLEALKVRLDGIAEPTEFDNGNEELRREALAVLHGAQAIDNPYVDTRPTPRGEDPGTLPEGYGAVISLAVELKERASRLHTAWLRNQYPAGELTRAATHAPQR